MISDGIVIIPRPSIVAKLVIAETSNLSGKISQPLCNALNLRYKTLLCFWYNLSSEHRKRHTAHPHWSDDILRHITPFE
nr:MAG TPA: hypothetical protein [Caudoviricetes sp.]